MRLLVDARLGWGHGIGRVIANTVPRIARSRPDWRIDALVHPDDRDAAAEAFADAPVALIDCPVLPFSLVEQYRLQRWSRGYDLTWFTNYWVPLAWTSPFVATVHDMLHLAPAYFPASAAKRRLARLTFAKVRRDARAVMFVSRFTGRAFAEMIGPPAGIARAIALGGDHLSYPVPRPIGARSRRLLVVAAAKAHKNVALLLDAWRQAQVAPHWTLTVVTSNSALRSSVDLGGAIRDAQRTEVRHGLSNAELAALYGDTAVLLMPSLYEGFGLPLLEGMMAGAWCVSSAAGAMVEVAQDGLVTFVNGDDRPGWTRAIEQVCGTIDEEALDLDGIQRHNRAVADRYRWNECAAGVAALLEQALVMGGGR